MTTMKQIADTLGIDKQRVYRVIRKQNIKEAYRENGILYYDEAAKELILSYLKQRDTKNAVSIEAHNEISEVVHEAVLYDVLREELKVKNEIIKDLSDRLKEVTQALAVSQLMAQNVQLMYTETLQQIDRQIQAKREKVDRKK